MAKRKKLPVPTVVVTVFLLIIAVTAGIYMLFLGIKGTVNNIKISKQYESAVGYLYDYELYSEGGYDAAKDVHTSDTYTLIYKYEVGGKDYTIRSYSGTSFIPELGSTQEIRYDPKNPAKAVFAGPYEESGMLIFMGFFFIGVPLMFVLPFIPMPEKIKKHPVDFMGALVGLFFAAIGYGALCFMTGSFSLKGIFEFFSIIYLIPFSICFLMIAAGLFLLFKSLFGYKGAK